MLQHALMQLPEDKREILILSRFQELQYDEIAVLLGCEVGVVKVRVHRALQQLREIYQVLESSPRAAGLRAAPETPFLLQGGCNELRTDRRTLAGLFARTV